MVVVNNKSGNTGSGSSGSSETSGEGESKMAQNLSKTVIITHGTNP
jgi:hypothetical protein